jgi:hypothetical protein
MRCNMGWVRARTVECAVRHAARVAVREGAHGADRCGCREAGARGAGRVGDSLHGGPPARRGGARLRRGRILVHRAQPLPALHHPQRQRRGGRPLRPPLRRVHLPLRRRRGARRQKIPQHRRKGRLPPAAARARAQREARLARARRRAAAGRTETAIRRSGAESRPRRIVSAVSGAQRCIGGQLAARQRLRAAQMLLQQHRRGRPGNGTHALSARTQKRKNAKPRKTEMHASGPRTRGR